MDRMAILHPPAHFSRQAESGSPLTVATGRNVRTPACAFAEAPARSRAETPCWRTARG